MGLQLRFTIPGLTQEIVPLDESRILIGTLLSNHVVLRAPGVDPIHGMLEEHEDSKDWFLTDLGSMTGIVVNGKNIDVEQRLKAGDLIEIGSVTLYFEHQPGKAPAFTSDKDDGNHYATVPVPPVQSPRSGIKSAVGLDLSLTAQPSEQPFASSAPQVVEKEASLPFHKGTLKKEHAEEEKRKEKREILFSPRKARPTGHVLEVVCYWEDTVLEVDLFHPKFKGFEKVTIGDPTKTHFIAGGPENITSHVFASVREDGYKISMLKGMEGRFRIGGKVEKREDEGKYRLGRNDLAHIKYGPVRYFFVFVKPPVLDLPRTGPRDALLTGLMTFAALVYLISMVVLWSHKPPEKKEEIDDIWSLVQIPEKLKPPPKIEQPKLKIEEVKQKPQPRKTPPPPKPKPITPAKPVETEKVAQPKPVEKPVEKPQKTAVANLQPQEKPKAAAEPQPDKPDLSKLAKSGTQGMPSTGAKKPDFKLAGPKTNQQLGAAGGPQGSGMNQQGGERKGKSNASVMGVEGPKNNKASGVNLSKLGLGVGKILNKSGPGAIPTEFRSSAGGAGGGSGSASKTYGLGGVGQGSSLGLSGASGAANNFGSGAGGYLSGQGGAGGLGGAGLGQGFGRGEGGRGRANVIVPPGDPVVSGGLTAQEIMAVIRANLNQIRHCYEQLLQRSPSASGKVKVNFVVGVDGRVTSASIMEGDISDSIMRGCVTGVIRRWKFPQPRGGQSVTVNYPFVFNPL